MLRINVLGGLYLSHDRRPLTGAAAQPRRLAVLALLAVAGERGLSRDEIVAELWPDNDKERGRHALTQSLYSLRRELGSEDLFLGQKDVRLNTALITSDYAEFRQALRSDAPEQAVELYQGSFLQGFHLPGVDTFDRWVEEQRSALAHDYGQALEAAARRAAGRQDPSAAAGYLRKRAAQDPLSPRIAIKLMEALAAQGEVVAALQHARVHEVLVRQELDLPPDREVTALVERLRKTTPSSLPVAEPAVASPSPTQGNGVGAPVTPGSSSGWVGVPAERQQQQVSHEGSPQWRPRWGLPGVVALAMAAVAVLAFWPAGRQPLVTAEKPRLVVAIGPILDYRDNQSGSVGFGRPLADMLATNMARASGIRVVSTARMLELTRQLGGASDSGSVVSAAARLAGAGELIDGSLYTVGTDRYRLDLRRVELSSGGVIGAYRVEGTDLFALVDSGTAHLVDDLGGGIPAGSLADVSTSSLQAYRLYEEGLRRYYDGDQTLAERLFRKALDADSGFAQAAFYYARTTTSGSRTETLDRLRRAVELAKHAGDRERLVIQAEWAAQNSSPGLPAIADTLTIRYPEELEGYFYSAVGAILNADYMKAEAPLRRIIALDSVRLAGKAGPRCRACEAYASLLYVYYAVDSQSLGHRLTREWVARQPFSAQAWRALAALYLQLHRGDSVLYAIRVADSLEPDNPMSRRFLVSIHSGNEEYQDAEQLLRSEMVAAPQANRRQAAWDLAVVLRQMGRLGEARKLAHEHRLGVRERLLPGGAPYNALLEAQVLFEQGDYRGSARLFDSIAVGQQGGFDSAGQYRDRIWAWAHEADALARLGDTVRLKFLADTMEVLGRSVGQARERNLHAHVRGLLARLRGRYDDAGDWFRRAMVSPVVGLTRTNYELADIYLRTGRPLDAVKILSPASRAGTVGAALYTTRTELEVRLAEAFDSAGQADSALLYYRKVLRAWESPDPEFFDRRRVLERAVGRLENTARR